MPAGTSWQVVPEEQVQHVACCWCDEACATLAVWRARSAVISTVLLLLLLGIQLVQVVSMHVHQGFEHLRPTQHPVVLW